MSATEAPTVTPAAEETKVVDTPAVVEPTTAAPVAEPAVEAPTEAHTTAATETPAESHKEEGKKSPSLLARILGPFKGDKKPKAPKVAKKEKEAPKEEAAATEATTATDTPKVEETPATAAVAEPVKETELNTKPAGEETPAATATPKVEEKPKPSPTKLSRRISASVNGLFKPKEKKAPVSATTEEPAKAEEAAPQVPEHTPVAPLDTAAGAEIKNESAPVVAAAA